MEGVEEPRARRAAFTGRDLAQVAVFAALIAALGLPGAITVGFSGVPITVQTLGVILAGAVLGARKGTAAVAVFLALTIIGLPLLSGGRTGLTALAGVRSWLHTSSRLCRVDGLDVRRV